MSVEPLERRSHVGPIPAAGPRDGGPVDDRSLARGILRRWWVVVAVTTPFLAVAGLYAVAAPKAWRATTRVLVERTDRTAGDPAATSELAISHDVLAAVVKREGLADDPAFATPAEAPEGRVSRAIGRLAAAVRVDPTPEKNLLDISVTAPSPETSARLSRAVAEAFVGAVAETEAARIQRDHGLLARRVADLRRKMVAAEAELEGYRRAEGVPAAGEPVDDEAIRRLTEAVDEAHRRTGETEARWARLRQTPAAADAAPVADELAALTLAAEIDHRIARAEEDDARRTLERARARHDGAAAPALRALESEAEARRALYRSLLDRMQETKLVKITGISEARVVAPAEVPTKPRAPRAVAAFLLALLGGLGAGLSAAVLLARRAARRRLAPVAPATEPARLVSATAESATPETAVAAPRPGREAVPPAPPPEAARAAPDDRTAPAGPRWRAPRRIDVALLPERIARLAPAAAGVAPVDAFVATADGGHDFAGLAMLRRLVDDLGGNGDGATATRMIFADRLPVALTAALAHGIARAEAEAGRRVMLVDLAADPAPFAPIFERAVPLARSRRRRLAGGFEVRADDHGVAFARPVDGAERGRPTPEGERLAAFVAEARSDHDTILLHVGGSPTAAALFDAADAADAVTLMVDAEELVGRRRLGEIEVMSRLVPRFDTLLVLGVAAEARGRIDERRRARRA